MKWGTIAVGAVEENRNVLENLAREIWENPETAFKEKFACERTAKVLEEAGFSVEIGVGGLPTAIRAVWGLSLIHI